MKTRINRSDRNRSESHIALWFGLALLPALVLTGCVTKAQAKAEARAAYLAGQQEAINRQQQMQFAQGPSVRINGPVKNSLLPWTPGLTLAKAMVNAEYQGTSDPAEIIVLHNGFVKRIDPSRLLDGEDMALQPGDVVQIVQAQPATAPPAAAQPDR